MNGRLKGLLIIFVNLTIVLAIAALWMQAIRKQRNERSEGIRVQIISESSADTLISTKEVYSWLYNFYKKDPRKMPVRSLNLVKLEEFINSQDLVKRSDIYLDSKEHLNIDIYQRHPIIRISDIQGNQFYLDEEGYKIPVSLKYTSRVIVATGNLSVVPGKSLDKKTRSYYSGLLDVAKALKKDTFANSLIEQIYLDENGEFTLIPKIGNERIFLGNSEILEDKLMRLKLFYKENMGRQGWNVYQLVNLKFKGQVIGKKLQQES